MLSLLLLPGGNQEEAQETRRWHTSIHTCSGEIIPTL
jgi:hypothetical protein